MKYNKKAPSFDMFYDYYRGVSQREIERKYNTPMRTIGWQCKKTMAYLFNNKDSFIHKNLNKIKEEIECI